MHGESSADGPRCADSTSRAAASERGAATLSDSYWGNVMNNRIGRRRVLLATGGSAAAAAFLAACGGGSKGDSSKSSSAGKSDKSSLVAQAVEIMPDKVKRGGKITVRQTGD